MGRPEPAAGAGEPVFVLCAGRSGSTLIRFLLDAHPELACPPETRLPWLCMQLASAWAVIEGTPLPDGEADEQPNLPEPVVAGLRQSLNPMIRSCLARSGKTRYCDKSLGGGQHAGLLRQVWPRARFLCLYRHPMDVISSGIEASPWGMSGYGFESYVAESPGNIVAALARYWADYTSAIVAAEEQFPASCLRVRYEDLVADPEAEAARMFEFAGVRPVPGIAVSCLTAEHQRFGPGDYKIWSMNGVTTDSVGRGWQVPARMIAPPLLARLNELADLLGYIRVDENWGTGGRPADLRVTAGLRVPADASRPAPVSAPAANGAARPAPGASLLGDRVRAGLARLGTEFTRYWESCSGESVLLFATAPAHAGADAWWRLDLGARTVTTGAGSHEADTDWTVTGSADSWERVLSGGTNLGVAFRRGELRYADKGDAGPGSLGADSRVAMMADLLGIVRSQPPGADAPGEAPAEPGPRSSLTAGG